MIIFDLITIAKFNKFLFDLVHIFHELLFIERCRSMNSCSHPNLIYLLQSSYILYLRFVWIHNSAMRKLLLILSIFLFCKAIKAQYTYRGQVFSVVRQEPITFGEVRFPQKPDIGYNGKLLAKIDSLGYFSFTLKDSSNVSVVIDCVLDGSTVQRLFYTDTGIKVFINTYCYDYNAERAKKDIEKNDMYLLCYLGYATYKFTKADSAFEKKYSITYYTFADTPIESDCMWLYNTGIAEYLDKKFGDAWRKEVRWDVPFKR
jgi:hypothetical protein